MRSERGIPHAYLLFEGEGHGFRKAETVVASLEAELSFYAQILGFEPGDSIPRLEIEHLPFLTSEAARGPPSTIPARCSPS